MKKIKSRNVADSGEVSCYSASLLIRYAIDNGISEEAVFDGLETKERELLQNPLAWTNGLLWTKLAVNIEKCFLNVKGGLEKIAFELTLVEATNYQLLFFKILPLQLLARIMGNHISKHANRSLRASATIDFNGQATVEFRVAESAHYSKQICDFNRGAIRAVFHVRNLRHLRVTEDSCICNGGSNSVCKYVISWKPTMGFFERLKDYWSVRFTGTNAMIQHLETSHAKLSSQYREISQLKESIEASRNFYQNIMENTSEGIIWLSEGGEVTYSNRAANLITGKAGKLLSGRRFAMLLGKETHPRFLAAALAQCRSNPGDAAHETLTFDTPTGIRSAEAAIKWVESSDGTFGYLVHLRDITEKRKIERQLYASESRYKSLYENSPAMIVGFDTEGRFIYANGAATVVLGYSEEELKELQLKDLLLTSSADEFFDVKIFVNPDKHVLREIKLKTGHENGWIMAAFSVYPLFDDQNRRVGTAGIGIDITETHRLNEQLVHSQRMDLLGKVAGGLAHDFNNLLLSINGYSQLIQGKSSDADIRDYAATIYRASDRASDITRNLLTFSRGEIGKREEFNVAELMREVKRLIEPVMPKMVEVVLELPSVPCVIVGDSGKLHQCLLNLCINARDAMGRKQGKLRLALRQEKQKVCIEVEDTGCGIAPEHINNIFDPFFSTKPKGKGTGLGLSVVYGIITAHNGTITCKSVPNEGTLFCITLPGRVVESPESEQKANKTIVSFLQ